MRLCRYEHQGEQAIGIYDETAITPLAAAAAAYGEATGDSVSISDDCLLASLPHGSSADDAEKVAAWAASNFTAENKVATADVQLLVPNPSPRKLFLLAGNYAAHIEEGGGIAAERAETFPYVFMKPPTTTLTNPGSPIQIPQVSPNHIDWELELGIVIGKEAKGVSEADALDYVAGYTVFNDISDRKFRPNPERKERDKDRFFDWLHGKWHDSFCPCGPCIVSAKDVPDPQTLELKLQVNGGVHQDASTAQMIFPVAAIVEFIASFVTLEPGDMISTGTAAGVGNTTGTYLKAGDRIEASISSIGTLVTVVE